MRITALLCLFCFSAHADVHLSRFGQGSGPERDGDVLRLLGKTRAAHQSNAVGFDRTHAGAYERMSLRCRLRVEKGGEGGAFAFLSTRRFGVNGPAPFVRHWVAPDLAGSLAVGIDLHNPPTKEPFGPLGNYRGMPQREVSLHWDGRELVKRVAKQEFRGAAVELAIDVRFVVGGAEVTVQIGEDKVYERYFVAHMAPYEARLAIGAETRAATTLFDVEQVRFDQTDPARKRRRPLHVEVFNHVLTNNKKTAYEAEVSLPPIEWAFGRVILTLEIHDAGKNWDEWDRNGELSIWDGETRLGIVPFITSYRTTCHWKVDVTHFRPLLAGTRRFEIRAGTTFYKNRGYMMSVTLDFHHGSPALEPYRVVPLWHGTAKYQSDENHFRDFFTPRTVEIDAQAAAARVATTTTGHSQIGEFTPSKRTLAFTPAGGEATRHAHVLWKTDCYLNPNRPQLGTWKYSRAGWAPGDVVRPWWIDLTAQLKPGKATFAYTPTPYDFSRASKKPTAKQLAAARHVVRSFLILYRKPTARVAAPTLMVSNVRKDGNAKAAGMKVGDYIASYDGKRVDSIGDLRAAIGGAQGKPSVIVVVYRGSQRVELTLKTGRMGINLATR